MSDLWHELDPGARFRAFDSDPESDAEAYRWTFFRPARPKLIAALSAVSGVEESVIRPWLLDNGLRYVVEGLALDTIVESLEDAWERLIVHDVVPDGAEWPRSWRAFADNAADLAMLASDWTNVRSAEALAIEAASRIDAWTPTDKRASSTIVRWTEIDYWSEPSSPIPWTFREVFRSAVGVWDDEDLQWLRASNDADSKFLLRLREACTHALNGWTRDVLLFSVSEETMTALAFARAFEAPEPSERGDPASLAKRKPDITVPVRAIRRLGYSLVDCSITDGVRVCTLAAPSFRWPHG